MLLPITTIITPCSSYFVHNLPKLQNMLSYRITCDTDIPAHVRATYRALPGPPPVPGTYLFSNESVPYLDTDCFLLLLQGRRQLNRMAGRMEQVYTQARACYRDYQYPDFHEYIAQNMND